VLGKTKWFSVSRCLCGPLLFSVYSVPLWPTSRLQLWIHIWKSPRSPQRSSWERLNGYLCLGVSVAHRCSLCAPCLCGQRHGSSSGFTFGNRHGAHRHGFGKDQMVLGVPLSLGRSVVPCLLGASEAPITTPALDHPL